MIQVSVNVRTKVHATALVNDKISVSASITGRERIIDMPHNSIEELYTCGENISSSNVIMLVGGLAYKYQPSDQANYGKAIGIARQAGLTGATIPVVLSGEVNVPGWGLTQDENYYAQDNGASSTSAPSSGLLNLIGIAKDSNTLIIDIDEPIIL